MKHIYFTLGSLLIFIISCNNESTNQTNEILNGQYVNQNNDNIITTIGNFSHGKKDGYFMYFDIYFK